MPHLTSMLKIYLLLLCLMTQAITPLGFMPSSMSRGSSLFEICPAQQPTLFEIAAGDDHQHVHHIGHKESKSSIYNDCQWSQAYIALTFFLVFLLVLPIKSPPLHLKPIKVKAQTRFKSPIRGPPA